MCFHNHHPDRNLIFPDLFKNLITTFSVLLINRLIYRSPLSGVQYALSFQVRNFLGYLCRFKECFNDISCTGFFFPVFLTGCLMQRFSIYIYTHTHTHTHTHIYIHRVSQEECAKLRKSVPYVKVYRYNPKHLYRKLNGYGDNGQRSLKL